MSDVTLSYKGSDILELSDSGSATLKTGGKYCEDDIAVEYVKPSGGEAFTPVSAILVHTGNAFDFGLQLNPLIHKIRLISGGAVSGSFSSGIYCSLSGSGNAFFAIAGRNGNYNRWQYGAYGSDNYYTIINNVTYICNPFGSFATRNFPIGSTLIGDGSIGIQYTEVPQTETILHVGSGFNASSIYKFMVYDTEQQKYLLCWMPVLDSNGDPCFFDSVNKEFVYNTGSGELGYTFVDGVGL